MAIDLTGKAVTTLKLPTTSYTGVPIETVYAQEGDMHSRIFRVQLYDERGAIDLSFYDTVKLSATNKNGDILVEEGEIDGRFGVCELSNDMLAFDGRLSCNVLFIKKVENGDDVVLTSRPFYVIVSKTHGGNADITEDESYNILVYFLEEVQGLIDDIEEAVEQSTDAAALATNFATRLTELESSKVNKKTTTGLYVYSHNGGEEGEIAVEDTPTNDSDNLVKSGGIKAALDGLSSTQAAAIAQAITDIKGGETTYDTLKKITDLIGAANGIAPLDEGSKIPSTYLPSYVDDILEYDNLAGFPSPGETGKIYVAKDTNLTYRWSGTAYVEISKSLALGETSSTAFRGDYGTALYDFAQSAIAGGLLKTQLDSKLNKTDKYLAPISLTYDTDNECWEWDYSESDNAVIEMTGSEPTTDIEITNVTAGDIGVVTVKGGQLTLPLNSVLSADFGYITAVGEQYYRYSFYYDGTNFEWHRTVLGEEDD